MNFSEFISKYNVQAPRYTSYPTVPYWDSSLFSNEEWIKKVKQTFDSTNVDSGISIYIHLPYCESLCTYCGCNTRITVNHKVEAPYIDAVLKEWKLYLACFDSKPNIREIHLGGGTPTFFSPDNLATLIHEITSSSNVLPDAEFSFEAHPSNTTPHHLKTLYSIGFRRISLGIQDFDIDVQEIINRHQTIEQVRSVVEAARKIGYTSVNFDLIYGLPLQKMSSIVSTIEKVNELRPDRIAFYSYAHVPWIKPGQRKFTEADLPVDIEKRALYEKGRSLFLQSGYEEIGMDHFALPSDSLAKAEKESRLHRNFMGYTHQYTRLMIGLGVSSISDSWGAFAQNLKTVEEYLQAVNNGKMPVFKGHLLNNEDVIIRKHILNIMCRYETEWITKEMQCDAVYEAIERFSELEKDGLIILKPGKLNVTEAGKSFLRNICMCFDARLWRNTPNTKVFSAAV